MIILKRIANWFCGGFFRKLGSFFAFFILGLILFSIVNSMDIPIFNKLFSNMIVYAYETSGYGSAQYMDLTVPVNSIGCITSTTETSSSWYNFGTEHTWGSNNKKFIKKTRALIQSGSYTWSKGNTYTIKVTLALNPKNYSNWYNGYKTMRLEGCTSTNSSTCNSSNLNENGSQFIVYNDTSSNYWVVYEITFVPQSNLKMIWIELNWGADGNTEYNSSCTGSNTAVKSGFYFVDFQWYRVDWVRYTPNNDYEVVSNAINTQTTIINNNFSQTNENINNVNNSINDLSDSLNDTNVSSDITTSSNFINNFTSSSETAITSLLTIPFTFLNSLVLGDTNDLCFTLKGVTACLPNGQRTIWTKNFNSNGFWGLVNNTSRDNFKAFFNLVVGGVLAYKCILDLIRSVHDWLTPDKDIVEVVDL